MSVARLVAAIMSCKQPRRQGLLESELKLAIRRMGRLFTRWYLIRTTVYRRMKAVLHLHDSFAAFKGSAIFYDNFLLFIYFLNI